MAVIITRYKFLEPFTDEQLAAIGRDLDPALARLGASWQRSYGSSDRLRLICEFAGNDVESVERAHIEANVAYEEVFAAMRWTAEEQIALHEHEQIERVEEKDVEVKLRPEAPRP